MTRKILTIVVVIFAIAGGFLLLQQQILANPVEEQQQTPDIAMSAEDLLLMKDLEALGWFEKIEEGDSPEEEAQLEVLAERQDAIGYLANEALGKIYDERGQGAAVYYQRALSLYETSQLKVALGKALEAEGKRQEAEAIYETVLSQEEAFMRMKELAETDEAMGEILVKNSQWTLLLEFQEGIFAETEIQVEELPMVLKKQRARALAELGRYEEALPLLEQLKTAGEADALLEWWLGRSLEAMGKEQEAITIYQGLGSAGGYRLGLLLEGQGQLAQAAEAFQASTQPVSLWKAAKLFDQLGEWQQAVSIYQQLAANSGTYQFDGAYRAYILMNRHQQSGTEGLLSLLSDQPAWMKRLGLDINRAAVSVEAETPGFLEAVEVYREAGKNQMAEIELSIGEQHATLEEKLGIGNWYFQQKQYDQAVVRANRVLREQPIQEAYLLAYPKPYEDLVLQAADEFEIDPYLIWAVIREESYYRADAVSWVGASGLMQIMPATGQEIAGRLNMPIENQDLLQPDINIRFGAYYIGRMLNLFEGNLDKALAAYNGGQGNVRKWENSPLGTLPEDFPTAITFLETQQYITKVSNSYYTYRWLYDAQ